MVSRGNGSAVYRELRQNDRVTKSLQNLRSAIARAIIHYNDFLARMPLGKGGCNGLPDKAFLVVTGDHDTKL